MPGNTAVPSESVFAADFYVDASAANDSGSGAVGSPKKYIQSGMALMTGLFGKTLVVKNGTYSNTLDAITSTGRGSASGYNRVVAETDGGVVCTRAPSLTGPTQDHYLTIEGISFLKGTEMAVIEGKRVKVLRCGFKGGPTTDNLHNLLLGTGDATPGAEYILIEDCWVYGVGGRYGLLVYNSDHIVLRRVVVRHQAGWTDSKGDPQACVALYNSTFIETQNLILVDTPPMVQFEKALYHPTNSRSSDNLIERGCIVVGCTVPAYGWDDGGGGTNMQQYDCVSVGADYHGVLGGNGHQVSMVRATALNTTVHGIRDFSTGGNVTVDKSALLNNAGNNNGATVTDSTTSGSASALGILYPVRVEAGSTLKTAGAGGVQRGAQVMTKIGTSGTVWGESGYNTDTGVPLWPFPNEARIKADMAADSAIGFCAGNSIDSTPQTLTKYVWEALGNQIPNGVY
jgi:hypothetical protein